MSGWRRDVGLYSRLAGLLLVLSACTTNPPPVEAPPPTPDIPATIRPEEVVGRWGYGSYHNEGDRKRTEAAARGQCGQPVVINRGPSGGVMMYLADSAIPDQTLRSKAHMRDRAPYFVFRFRPPPVTP